MQSGRYDRRKRRERITSQPKRQAQARGGGRDQRYRSSRNYRTIKGTDTGYNLQKRNINFGGGGAFSRNHGVLANPRFLMVTISALVVLALLLFGITRCVSSCSANTTREEVNEQDSRVALGVSSELTTELTKALDQGEQIASIAARANELDDDLVRLALSEPTAIGFVASFDPHTSHAASPYEAGATKGSYPKVYCWDTRWGAVEFAGNVMALTGSGPTALFIARMGIIGNADVGPADIAELATKNNGTDSTLGLSPTFFTKEVATLGLSVKESDLSSEHVLESLDTEMPVLLLSRSRTTLGEKAHWLVITNKNSDGTVSVCDPCSPSVSSRPWAASTLVDASEALYVVSTPSETEDDA